MPVSAEPTIDTVSNTIRILADDFARKRILKLAAKSEELSKWCSELPKPAVYSEHKEIEL